MRKKALIRLALLFALLTPSAAFATVTVLEPHILFSWGLNNVAVSVQDRGESVINPIRISGDAVEHITLEESKIQKQSETVLEFFPPGARSNSYSFWKIKGTQQEKNFYIFGYTQEIGGDTWIEQNPLLMDGIKILLAVLFLIYVKKQYEKSKNK